MSFATGSKFSTNTFLIIFLISFLLVVHLLYGFFTPIIMALVIVSVLGPFYDKLVKICFNRRYVAASILTTLVFLCLLIPLGFFFIALMQQALSLIKATQQIKNTDGLEEWLLSLRSSFDFLRDYLKTWEIDLSIERLIKFGATISQYLGRKIYEVIGSFASNLVILSFHLVVTLILVFVFFVSGAPAKKFAMEIIPLPHSEKEAIISRFKELSFAVFIGNGLISAAEGMLSGFLFFLFDIEGAILWGVVIAITAFLPAIGASIVIIPASIYLFLVAAPLHALLFLLLNSIHLTILEMYIKPRLIGSKSQIHAVLIFLSIIAGIQLHGVFGIFFGPLAVTIFLALSEIYRKKYREKLLSENQ